jgi:hypothetical protein
VSANSIRLLLHAERDLYSIGEPIRPQLQIINGTAERRELGQGFRFDWDILAFTDPNFVHLIGSGGAELALPYRREPSYFAAHQPIVIEAGKEEWLYLPIYAHLHLREPGAFTFWLDLLDDLGQLHRTNRIPFELTEVKTSVPPERLGLTLRSQQSAFGPVDPIEVEAVFTNNFGQPLTFLKPQQDSFYGWVNPVYQFTMVASAGCSLALARRGGTMATPIYDATTQFTLPTGASQRLVLPLPLFPQMRQPDVYRVRLTYLMRERAIGKAGVVLDQPMRWSADVFIGRIESNELLITIK